MRVLIVDDDRVCSERASSILHGIGIRCETAESAEQALEMAQATDYQMFLLDIHLEGLNGIEFCRIVKDKAAVIFGSKDSTEAAKVMCFEAGADDFIEKPISEYELICRVKAVMRRCKK